MMARYLMMALLPLALSACTSNWDMYGMDPKDYYKENPIINKVETRHASHTVRFAGGSNRLSADEIDSLKAALRDVSPLAAETVQVHVSRAQLGNATRREYLTKLVKHMGFKKELVVFEPSETLVSSEAEIHVAYASVVSPRCPDWRTSPVTTYSNTTQAGWSCANVTNLGLMVADPRDLARGSGGQTGLDSQRNSDVAKRYRSNEDFPPNPNAGAASSDTEATTTATTTAPTQ